jgi:hypothetical protein
MTVRMTAVSFDAQDPASVGAFWAGLLEREIVPTPDGVFLPGDARQVGLRFVSATTERTGRDRLHLHVTTESDADRQRILDTVHALGGTRRGTGPLPTDSAIFMLDPGGNDFCVIEPGNGYLAGCGRLGEVTCEGTRAVGEFWRDALGWPVVWDEGDEIAIQSPSGGTKLAWDAWPDAPRIGRDRQRFELTTDDLDADVDRLMALGAAVVRTSGSSAVLTDPDGDAFTVRVDIPR